MKIVYMTGSVLPSRAANTVQVMRMCDAFAKAGHDVVLFAKRPAEEIEGVDSIHAYYGVEETFEIRRFRAPRIPGLGQMFAWAIARNAKRENADLVYSRYFTGCLYSACLGMPVTLELHRPMEEKKRVHRFLFRRLLRTRNLRSVVVISAALKRHYVEAFGIDPERVRVVHDASQPGPECAKNPHPTFGPGFHVGYVGHLYKGKGMETISGLASRLPDMTFHVVGGLSEDIQNWSERTRELENLRYHGYLPPAKIQALLNDFDTLIAPYQKQVEGYNGEGVDISPWMSPLKIFEYMAAGRPIVCSDLPVLREVLSHGETALMVPPDDEDAWTKALQQLRDDAILGRRLGESARKEFLANHTWEKRVQRVLDEESASDDYPAMERLQAVQYQSAD